jgi:AraC-like DNA-binding protein
MTLADILYIGVIAQGLLLALLVLLMRRNELAAPLFLSAFIFLSTLGLLGHVAGSHNVVLYAPLYSLFLLVVLKSPALYLYLRALTEPGFRWGHKELRHLLLLLPGLIFSVGLLNNETGDTVEVLADAQAQATNVFALFMRFVVFAYTIASLRLLLRHQQFLESHFSLIEKISLNWLKWLLLLVLGFECVRLGLYALALVEGSQPSPLIVLLINASIIYTVAFGGLRQPLIFTESITRVIQRAQEQAPQPTHNPDKPQTQENDEDILPANDDGSGYDSDNATWQQLEQLMKKQEPFRDSSLSLPDLAQQAGFKARELSGLINRQYGGSFYEYVNYYRVLAAKRTLSDPTQAQQKLLTVAMDAGFNSESTFYTHFKKHCGSTPRKFRQAQLATATQQP